LHAGTPLLLCPQTAGLGRVAKAVGFGMNFFLQTGLQFLQRNVFYCCAAPSVAYALLGRFLP
jgi:hypothetical protein